MASRRPDWVSPTPGGLRWVSLPCRPPFYSPADGRWVAGASRGVSEECWRPSGSASLRDETGGNQPLSLAAHDGLVPRASPPGFVNPLRGGSQRRRGTCSRLCRTSHSAGERCGHRSPYYRPCKQHTQLAAHASRFAEIAPAGAAGREPGGGPGRTR
jgi:hypothetical protein